MKQNIGSSNINGSRIALGCMRMAALDVQRAKEVIKTAIDSGITFFDHADIYGGGASETIFGEAFKELGIKREDVVLQTKCGINKDEGSFDFSKEHIIKSVNESLARLQVEYVDILALHRPDSLMDPVEINEAFKQLKSEGKVKFFGVSNQNPMQMQLLQSGLEDSIIVNQVQFSLKHTPMIDFGINVNMIDNPAINREGGIIEYSRLNNITLQTWSPFYSGFFDKVFIDHPDFPELNTALQEIADKYNASKEAVAIAWILRHPAKMQAIVGSMNPERIKKISKAYDFELSRQEWYHLYKEAGNRLP